MGPAFVESQYINAWDSADSRTRTTLTQVANWVDANLAEDPDQKGQQRADLAARILAISVANSSARASVTFQVLPADRQVRVVRLHFVAE